MGSLIETLFSSLYVKLRGPSVVKTAKTKQELKHPHRYTRKDGTEGYLLIVCQQFKHVIEFERWYMPNQTEFSYHVYVAYVSPDEIDRDYQGAFFPHLCSRWLRHTPYPLYCAISAYLDTVLHMDKKDLKTAVF